MTTIIYPFYGCCYIHEVTNSCMNIENTTNTTIFTSIWITTNRMLLLLKKSCYCTTGRSTMKSNKIKNTNIVIMNNKKNKNISF